MKHNFEPDEMQKSEPTEECDSKGATNRTSKFHRCPTCGTMIEKNCIYCHLLRILEGEQVEPHDDDLFGEEDKNPLCDSPNIKLLPHHYRRYLKVRKQRIRQLRQQKRILRQTDDY